MSTASIPTRSAGSTGKLVFFIIFALLTLFVTVAKNVKIFDPKSEIAQHFAPTMGYLAVHAAFGGLALVLGAFQFSNRLRARYLNLHRKLGYLYVLGVFVSSPFSIPVAIRTGGSPSLVAAASTQSFGWMVTTAIALYCIKRGNVAQHRRWMIRSYPFAMVFTVARMIIPIPPVLALGMPGVEMVVWLTIAAAALLPSIFLDWREIKARPASV